MRADDLEDHSQLTRRVKLSELNSSWHQLRYGSTVERHLSGLTGTARHRDMQIIRIIGFFKNKQQWQFEVRLL
jgi:hypothetical protein